MSMNSFPKDIIQISIYKLVNSQYNKLSLSSKGHSHQFHSTISRECLACPGFRQILDVGQFCHRFELSLFWLLTLVDFVLDTEA